MHWRFKAKINKACAALPSGDQLYMVIQKIFGRLKANPMARIPHQVKMAQWIIDIGGRLEGKTFFEVGTGHNPIVPIGFFLCGANKVVTIDLHRRLNLGILKKSLDWMVKNRDTIEPYYIEVTEPKTFDKAINLINSLKDIPQKLLSEANILYLAPADASNTDLLDDSVNYHISSTVFEHITRTDIKKILKEAKRILKKDGVAIHFIDLSDHFQHQDNSISTINFLRYSEKEWEKIAGNQFAYHNRLRVNDYFSLFKEAGFIISRYETTVDYEAIQRFNDGFSVNKIFRQYSIVDLCTIQLRVALKVR